MTLNEAVAKSLAALKADPKFKGAWDEDRAWKHVRETTGLFGRESDQYLQQVADRVQQAVNYPDKPLERDGEAFPTKAPSPFKVPDVEEETTAPAP